MGTTTRVFNFAAGPAVLPLPVLEEAQRDLVALPGVGMSVLEISHRSKTFEAIIQECEANIRKLVGVPENYHVLFLAGGATLQFSMVPLNLLAPGETADYITTGAWSEKALKEANKVGNHPCRIHRQSRELRARAETAGSEAHAERCLRASGRQ